VTNVCSPARNFVRRQALLYADLNDSQLSRAENSLQLITRSILISILLLGCVGCDQVTKGIAQTYLMPGDTHSYLHDTFRLVLARNTGAFLSIGENLPETLRMAIFIGGVSILTLGSLLAALFAPRLNRSQVAAFALIGSGGLGNLIDRLAHYGTVTDFLNIGIGSLRTGIFNFADVVLMVGLSLLCLVGGRSTPTADNPT
jgi:signal peptidase II